MKRLLAVGVVLSLPLAAYGADTYSTYSNARFGYSVLYPDRLVSPRPEAPNGDGRVFKSRDGKTTLSVWGENNVFNRSLSAQLAFSKSEWAKDKARVTYAKVGNGFYVISGFTGNQIFYEKTIPLRGRLCHYAMAVPSGEKNHLGCCRHAHHARFCFQIACGASYYPNAGTTRRATCPNSNRQKPDS